MTYYISEDGDDDLESMRPMTRDEMLAAYPEMSEDDPTLLADLYIDFHDFDRIEFLIFKDRMSSAVLSAAAARRGIDEALARFETKRKDGSHRIPGWEGESDMVLDEAISITNYSYDISIGATIVTAVAALESLLADLAPDSEPKQTGLHRLLQAFLRRYRVPRDEAAAMTALGLKIGKRRNTFAHSLTGSYWGKDPAIAAMFTPETMEDTLYTVGELAVSIDWIVQSLQCRDQTGKAAFGQPSGSRCSAKHWHAEACASRLCGHRARGTPESGLTVMTSQATELVRRSLAELLAVPLT